MAQRRRLLGAALGVGACDGRQLLRVLNRFSFSREEVEAALAAVEAAGFEAPGADVQAALAAAEAAEATGDVARAACAKCADSKHERGVETETELDW